MGFTPRLTVPEKTNKYYLRLGYGFNPAIAGKPQYCPGSVLSNCVGYAVGRFNEIGGYGACKYLTPCNAERFIDFAGKLETGKTPKLGAVIVWQGGATKNGSDGAGHVAVVEQVNADGSIVTSESGYGSSKAFWTRTRRNDGNWGQGSSYKFLGFIYNPAVEDEMVEKIKVYSGGKVLTVDAINKDGYNYVKMRDFDNVLGVATVSYDNAKKMPRIERKV